MRGAVRYAAARHWLPAGLIMLGLVLAMIANAALLRDWYLLRTGMRAAATVVDGRPDGRSQAARMGGTLVQPTLRFRTPDGQVVAFRASTLGRRFHIGEIVTVVYREQAPETAMLAEYAAIWPTPLAFGLCAAVLIGGGLLARAALPSRPISRSMAK